MITTNAEHVGASQQVMPSTSNEVLNRLVGSNASWVVRVPLQKQDFKETPIQISSHPSILPTDMIDNRDHPDEAAPFLAGGHTTQHQET